MENKIKKDLEQSIKNSNDIVSNMSRFYTKTNKVIGNSRKIVFWKSTEGNEIVKVFFVGRVCIMADWYGIVGFEVKLMSFPKNLSTKTES